jgi:hypothetical protein
MFHTQQVFSHYSRLVRRLTQTNRRYMEGKKCPAAVRRHVGVYRPTHVCISQVDSRRNGLLRISGAVFQVSKVGLTECEVISHSVSFGHSPPGTGAGWGLGRGSSAIPQKIFLQQYFPGAKMFARGNKAPPGRMPE